MTAPLFPELSHIDVPILPLPSAYQFFIVAYWPRGKYWEIKSHLTTENYAEKTANELRDKGWQHITIFRLPLAGPWAAQS